jgi:hypothetical protein
LVVTGLRWDELVLTCMVVTQNAKGCYPSHPVTVVITGGSGSGTGNSSGGSGSGSVSATPTLTSTVQVPGNSTVSQVSTASTLVPLSVLSAEDAATATVVQLTRPVSTDPDTAPSVSVISGAAVAPVAQGLPVSSTFTASVSLADRVGTQLGVTTSDSTGRATVPAFQATQAGVYTISLSDGKGNTYYLKIQVAAAPSGVGLPSDADAGTTVLVSVTTADSSNAANAPTANVPVGTPVAPVVGGLPANTVINVDNRSTGQQVRLVRRRQASYASARVARMPTAAWSCLPSRHRVPVHSW